jgi:methylenetetrahydrofolate--tRNA-(uracil-5-)-methyltransferase
MTQSQYLVNQDGKKTAKDFQITIIGGGLAGCEAAYQAAAAGLKVRLFEMKPQSFSPAHRSPNLAELVCSNSLRSDDPKNAVGLLKKEMRLLGSLVMKAAERTKVPAGQALAVDREAFSSFITKEIENNPNIDLIRTKAEDIFSLNEPKGTQLKENCQKPLIIATGPLAGPEITEALKTKADSENLYFYDALAPIVSAESLNFERIFEANRYGEEGRGGDYLNCPLDDEELNIFMSALLEADKVRPHPFEAEKYFEGCLPIEVLAGRGPRTLTFGPMKPVGLIDPRTKKRPAAVVQLRRENLAGTHFNLVGFQTRLTVKSQEKVFRLIPGLNSARFARYGAIHRNTYVNAPKVLDAFQRLLGEPYVFLAGQISGVEGYVESAAQGLWVGQNAARLVKNLPLILPPRASALGSLLAHLSPDNQVNRFCPSNINFGLFPAAPLGVIKRQQAQYRLDQAEECWKPFLGEIDYAGSDC